MQMVCIGALSIVLFAGTDNRRP